MDIAVVGTGYVGLVIGAVFADMGNRVICVDNDKEKLRQLESGIIPIYEPGLEEIVRANVQEQRLFFSSDLDYAVKKSQICFITVETPQCKDGSTDLQYVLNVAEAIAKSMNGYKVIVNKSTVPVGTADKVSEIIKAHTEYPFDVVSNPEFLKQGSAVNDFLSPDRVIIGSDSDKATFIMQELYSPFFRTGNRIIVMDIKSAEMSKYAANSFLAAKISFMNEIANLCEKVGADVESVRMGISADTRIGNKFLFPGLGYGGSCFPKDVKALIKTGIDYNCDMSILKAVDSVNKEQRKIFIRKILEKFGENLKGLTFAIWGLSYKPKTNDMREAPSVTIINELLARGAKIKAFDPKAMTIANEIWKDKIDLCSSAYSALENADCLLLLTEWNEFRKPDFDKIKNALKQSVIFDGRNQYDKNTLKENGIEYYPIGNGKA